MNRELNPDQRGKERYLHLPLEVLVGGGNAPVNIEVQVKLDDDGVVVDAFSDGLNIGSTWKTYPEMGIAFVEWSASSK